MFKFHPSHLALTLHPHHGLVTNYKNKNKWLNHTLLFLVSYSNADLVLTTIKDTKDYRFLSTAYFKQNMFLSLCSHVTKAFLLLKYIAFTSELPLSSKQSLTKKKNLPTPPSPHPQGIKVGSS